MKLPFLKKNKPAPAPVPETPAAPRAPFPFAAPAQDEPVPAIHIDARVLAFLRKYDAAPDQLDTQKLTDAMLAAMQRGLRGEAACRCCRPTSRRMVTPPRRASVSP